MALYDDLLSPDLRIRNARSELDENYLFDPANEIPNAETIAALQEYEEMMKHPERYKTYDTIEEAVADVLSEDSDNSADPFYSESNIAHILRGIAALDAGKGIEHELIEPDFPLAIDEMDDETFKAMIYSRFEEVKRGEGRTVDEVFNDIPPHT